jgi:hypothetical protein
VFTAEWTRRKEPEVDDPVTALLGLPGFQVLAAEMADREWHLGVQAPFGFAELVRIGENHRAQLRLVDAAVIVGDVRRDRRPPRPGEVTHSVMGRVDDARTLCERAWAHGARILMEPTDFEDGERQCTAQDLPATNGRSPKPSPTLPPRNGAGNPSTPGDRDDPHGPARARR